MIKKDQKPNIKNQKFQQGNILGVLILILMVAALVGGVFMVNQVQRTRTKASGSGLNLSLSTADANVAPGEEFLVNILLDPSGANLKVSALSLNLNYPADKLELTSATAGQFFLENHVSSKTKMLNKIDVSNPGWVKAKLGVPCTTSQPVICYPKGGAGIVATLKFKTKTGASGDILLRFDKSSAIAAINETGEAVQTNVLADSDLPTLGATITTSSEVKPVTATTAPITIGMPKTIDQLRRRLKLLE